MFFGASDVNCSVSMTAVVPGVSLPDGIDYPQDSTKGFRDVSYIASSFSTLLGAMPVPFSFSSE